MQELLLFYKFTTAFVFNSPRLIVHQGKLYTEQSKNIWLHHPFSYIDHCLASDQGWFILSVGKVFYFTHTLNFEPLQIPSPVTKMLLLSSEPIFITTDHKLYRGFEAVEELLSFKVKDVVQTTALSYVIVGTNNELQYRKLGCESVMIKLEVKVKQVFASAPDRIFFIDEHYLYHHLIVIGKEYGLLSYPKCGSVVDIAAPQNEIGLHIVLNSRGEAYYFYNERQPCLLWTNVFAIKSTSSGYLITGMTGSGYECIVNCKGSVELYEVFILPLTIKLIGDGYIIDEFDKLYHYIDGNSIILKPLTLK